MLGEHRLAVDDYGKAMQFGMGGPSLFNLRGVANFAISRFEEAILDFDQELKSL